MHHCDCDCGCDATVNATVTATVAVVAELPWTLLHFVCICTREERVAVTHGGVVGELPAHRWTDLLRKAVEHAGGLLRGTATDEINVSHVLVISSTHP
jgi:hypothetical protein